MDDCTTDGNARKKISFLGNNAHASSEVAYRVMNAISDFTFLVLLCSRSHPNEVLMVFVFTFAILDSDCCGGKCADNIQYALTHSSIDSTSSVTKEGQLPNNLTNAHIAVAMTSNWYRCRCIERVRRARLTNFFQYRNDIL